MVCQFLLYNKVNQLYIYICPHSSSLLHLPPSHPPYPTPLGGHKAPSRSLCAMRLLPTSYLFYVWQCIYMSMLLSHFVPVLREHSLHFLVKFITMYFFFLFDACINGIIFKISLSECIYIVSVQKYNCFLYIALVFFYLVEFVYQY